MAYTKEGQFISGANLDSTRVRKMLVQIQLRDCDIKQARRELQRVFKEFNSGLFKDLIINFYGIVHDKDLDHCNNNHLHILLELSRSVRLLTMLNNFRDAFGYDTGAISIDKCVLVYGSLRYFLHLDGDVENKHEYNINDIVTNVSSLLLSTYIDSDDDAYTVDRLIEICYSCQFDIIQIMRKVDLDNYKKYRYVIRDICDKEFQISNKRNKDIDKDLLPF